LHRGADLPLERRPFPSDLLAEQRFRGLDLLPRLEWTVPSPADTGLDEALVNQHLRFWSDLSGRVAEVQGLTSPTSVASVHRLLGHPQPIRAPGPADGTKLLLQVDSAPPTARPKEGPRTGMMWGDCGRVYYLIGEDELRAHRFAQKPWATVEMH